MQSRSTRNWPLVEHLIKRAGSQADPAEQGLMLRAVGADVTRNSRAQWIANPNDPQVQRWLRELAGAPWYEYEPNPEATPALPDSAYFQD